MDVTRRDLAVVAAVEVWTLGAGFALHHFHAHTAHTDALGWALLGLGGAALFVRRRHPVAAVAGTFSAGLVFVLLGNQGGAEFFPLIVAFVGAAAAGHRRAAEATVVAGYAWFVWLVPVVTGSHLPTLGFSVGLLAWLLFLLSLGELIRFRRERSAQAAHAREEEALRRLSEERLRIARDVHDIVAHHLSLINVQASSALHLHDTQPERAGAALAAIKDASKDALEELRSLLGVLRRAGEDPPLAPALGVDHIDDLVSNAATTGLDVDVVVDGVRRPLPPPVDVVAYRIVQEALTNVTRHAHANAATIHLSFGQDDVVVEVDDDGHGVGAAHHPGTGIIGMTERATALGGRLQTGPGPRGGFRVRAWLPVGSR